MSISSSDPKTPSDSTTPTSDGDDGPSASVSPARNPRTGRRSLRLPAEVTPERYRLNLRVDPKKRRFEGEVQIDLEAPKGWRTLELHSVDLEHHEIEVLDRGGPIEIRRVHLDTKRERLVLGLRSGLRSAHAQLRIRFSGPLRDDLRGLYAARSGSRRYASTQLEAADARRFFPCFDEPDKKARFELQVSLPKGMVAVSNGPVVRRERGPREETWYFAETPPLSTYLIALVVGELESSRVRKAGRDQTPIRVWAVPGRKAQMGFALEAAAASLERLEKYFGSAYPYAKLDLIAVPDFEFGAMENAGAVTFRETLLLVDPKTISLPERKRVAEVIAHELAHMWFGDLVTMAWWDDLWLNEAFATWMAFSVVDDWKPEWKMWLDFQQSRCSAFGLDALQHTHPIYTEVRSPDEATENFDLITYEKGASVVRMLERWLGPRDFRRGVRQYIRRHHESNARAEDLWNALASASGRPVESVVRAWISRAGFPVLHVEKQSDGLRVCQQRYAADAKRRDRLASEAPWPIPAVLRWRGARGRARSEALLIDGAKQTIPLPVSELRFVYANAEESGFYRPLHDPELLRSLGAHWDQLLPVERMGLLQHQWAGVRAGLAPLTSVLDLVPQLSDEPEAEVLRAAYDPLCWLVSQLGPELSDARQSELRSWLADLLGPSLRQLGLRPARREPEERRTRRAALLSLVGDLTSDDFVSAEIETLIGPYLKDRSSLDANLATSVVRLAARSGDKARYNSYLRAMKSATTAQERTRFLFALGDFRDPALIQRSLELLPTPKIPTQDVVILAVRLLENPAAGAETWRFIQANWAILSPRISTGLASRLVAALPSLRTRTHRKQVAEFFRAHPLPSASRALRQALERFDLEARLRRRLKPELERWLKSQGRERQGRA